MTHHDALALIEAVNHASVALGFMAGALWAAFVCWVVIL